MSSEGREVKGWVQMNIEMPADLRNEIRVAARQRGETISAFGRRLMRAEIERIRGSMAGIALDAALAYEREEAERTERYRERRQARRAKAKEEEVVAATG